MKTRRVHPNIKNALAVLLTALLLGGLAFAFSGCGESLSAATPTPAPTMTPEPTATPTPEPVVEGGYMVCEDGLFYPEAPMTGRMLVEALREAGYAPDFEGETEEPLTEDGFEEALESVFSPADVAAAMGTTVLRGGDGVTRAEAAVVLNRLVKPERNLSEGSFPDVEIGYWAHEDIRLAASCEKVLEPDGFFWVNGYLYCVGEDGNLLKNTWLGSLYFGPDGRYTSGSTELDDLVAEFLLKNTADDMTREEKLRAVYEHVRDDFSYLVRNYYRLGDVGWGVEEAATMLSTGRGNCYCYSSTFWACARGLGYDAKLVSGTYGDNRAPHGWVEIYFEDGRLTYDVEIEMAQHRDGHKNSDMYALDEHSRRGHMYIELADADNAAPREHNDGLQPY